MKVLTIVGNPAEKYGRQYREDLAKVWVDDKHRIYVAPVNLAKPEFAVELQRLIDERIEKSPGKPPFFTWLVSQTHGDDNDFGHRIRYIGPEDSDFLDNFMGDRALWGVRREIAGYKVHTGESEVSEE